jgi:hypothetical protein
VLAHVPLGDELLPARVTLIRSDSVVLPDMDIVVGPGVVFVITAFVWTIKFIMAHVCIQMVLQDPSRSKFLVAVREGALLPGLFIDSVSLLVVVQMLRHFKSLGATRLLTLKISNLKMFREVLIHLTRNIENLFAILKYTRNLVEFKRLRYNYAELIFIVISASLDVRYLGNFVL